jgi:hypothetical protein
MATTFTYLGAYLLTCVGGWLAVACALWGMRRLVLDKNRPPFIDRVGILVGVTERAVALTLVLMAPSYLPSFIGGWVLLKFAIGWQREKHGDQIAEQSFLALIGSVVSFAIAIAIGVALNQKALDVWATAPR